MRLQNARRTQSYEAPGLSEALRRGGRLGGPSSGGERDQSPNILYLHSHDTGRYIQPYGYAAPAPHLQELASGGVLFRRAFSAAPTCSPSRAALLTGQCPHSCGMLGLVNHGFTLAQYPHHLARTLKRAGYLTAVTGVQHILTNPEQAGYDRSIQAGAAARTVAPAAVQFLSEPPRQPFFFAAGFFETHRPFPQPGPREDARYTLPPGPIADTPETRADMAGYKASLKVLIAPSEASCKRSKRRAFRRIRWSSTPPTTAFRFPK